MGNHIRSISAVCLLGLFAIQGCSKRPVGYHIYMVNRAHADLDGVAVFFNGKPAAEKGYLPKGGLASYGFVFLPIPEQAEVRWIDERKNPSPPPPIAPTDYSPEAVARLRAWMDKGEHHSPKVKLTGIVPKEPAHMNIYFIIEDDNSVTVKCVRYDDLDANMEATKGISELRQTNKK